MNPTILETLLKNPNAHAAPQTPQTTPQKPPRRKHGNHLLLLLGLGVLFFILALTAWSAISNPALAAVLEVGVAPTSAPAQSWAQVVLAKPTYTSTATILPSPTPNEVIETVAPIHTLEPVNTPGGITAQIVSDTATPEANSPQTDDVPAISAGGKYILVSISEQHLYAYENNALVYSFIASTGMRNATRTGRFSVLDKIPNAYGATWDIWMPNWLGIYYAGTLENGIHALPILPSGATLWAGFLGTPISYGCVVLGTNEAQELYNWAEIGTPVEIQW